MPLIVGASFTFVTVMLNPGRYALVVLLSVTVMIMLIVIPTSALDGVPVNAPVAVSKLAQDGWFTILNVSVSPTSTSPAVGVKLYGSSSFTDVAGVPLMVGLSFTFVTVISKAGNEVLAVLLSVTAITMPVVVPTSAFAGVPVNSPVLVSKLVQDGWFMILNVSVSPASTSPAVGVKL